VFAALVAGAVLVAGCGSEKAAREKAPEKAAATPTRSTDENEAADIALRYFDAVVAKDWKAVCKTRTKKERSDLARLLGSCERGFEKVLASKPVDIFDGVKAGDVRIEGDIAGVDIHQPGQPEPALTIAAVREGGRWLLEDVPDAQIP
jgi:hypothetical protein